jgi:hypothetical protein
MIALVADCGLLLAVVLVLHQVIIPIFMGTPVLPALRGKQNKPETETKDPTNVQTK